MFVVYWLVVCFAMIFGWLWVCVFECFACLVVLLSLIVAVCLFVFTLFVDCFVSMLFWWDVWVYCGVCVFGWGFVLMVVDLYYCVFVWLMFCLF